MWYTSLIPALVHMFHPNPHVHYYILILIFICVCKLLLWLIYIYYQIYKAIRENGYLNSNLCMCQAHFFFQIQIGSKYPLKRALNSFSYLKMLPLLLILLLSILYHAPPMFHIFLYWEPTLIMP